MYPECHGNASGVLFECIRSAKIVKKMVGGTVYSKCKKKMKSYFSTALDFFRSLTSSHHEGCEISFYF